MRQGLDPSCAGCLCDGKCWVCLGHGGHGTRPASAVEFESCTRCLGTGICTVCSLCITLPDVRPQQRSTFGSVLGGVFGRGRLTAR
jgi:hypothetical protein